ncbi:unnamed protein product [Closterium sp. Naga37s-1]|nr:unnamed protein product [Closterium sp. Naga37s-1]
MRCGMRTHTHAASSVACVCYDNPTLAAAPPPLAYFSDAFVSCVWPVLHALQQHHQLFPLPSSHMPSSHMPLSLAFGLCCMVLCAAWCCVLHGVRSPSHDHRPAKAAKTSGRGGQYSDEEDSQGERGRGGAPPHTTIALPRLQRPQAEEGGTVMRRTLKERGGEGGRGKTARSLPRPRSPSHDHRPAKAANTSGRGGRYSPSKSSAPLLSPPPTPSFFLPPHQRSPSHDHRPAKAAKTSGRGGQYSDEEDSDGERGRGGYDEGRGGRGKRLEESEDEGYGWRGGDRGRGGEEEQGGDEEDWAEEREESKKAAAWRRKRVVESDEDE